MMSYVCLVVVAGDCIIRVCLWWLVTCMVSSEDVVVMVVGDRCVSWVMRAWWWRWVVDMCGKCVLEVGSKGNMVNREDDDVSRLV